MALRNVLQQAVRSSSSSLTAAHVARAYSNGRYVNHIELLGRVGTEPRKIGANEAVAFPLYTESSVRLKDGSTKIYSCWHKVLFVKKTLGDLVFNNVDRGQRVYITGRVAYKAAESTEDGKQFHSNQAAIIAEQIVFLEKSRKTGEEPKEQTKESLAG
ncbi:single-stranded DNA-binding protein, mitochondrial [Thrips palmi]|uniref:Single-stranded DNA-binding protein, mitochondrial n=1 Tax=Thrips palmi TaxID=161013 RepID=A0A6P9A1X2_THRPL|nr:single-stranded DNA-binding protein, mitochondrial [Thrips palmi]